jgi:1-acyl-sn-glycerol-3-phosphate acyltransferase
VEAWTLIPIVAIVMWGVQGVARALRGVPDPRRVHRRRGGGLVVGGLVTDDEHGDAARIDESVRAELEELRQRVAELEERQDFTERVLTRGSHDPENGGRGAP